MAYDLLIRGGTLVDPAQGIHARRDVAFAGGKVAAVGADLSTAEAAETIDATGKIVTPGLIDLHAHVFHDISHFGIEPDRTCLATGATTVLDAGSAGADTMGGFRRFVIAHSATRVLVLLNISSQGLLTAWIGENNLPEYADVARAVASAQQHPGVVVGIKVRLTRNTIVSERVGMLPLYRAREAADALGLPLMVHPQDAWCDSLDDVLAYMRPGDLLT
ncbi:MAG: amidohydrolase/deacetylase family metallohydrolase, partial [Anaerolineales bacterium]|nr:amidohydrolase/deacetylase family metallohydrolase [Anaerolineales bacterium]